MRRRRRGTGAGALAAGLAVLLVAAVYLGRHLPAERLGVGFRTALSPVAGLLADAGNALHGFFGRMEGIFSLEAENGRLRAELQEMRYLRLEVGLLRSENRDLEGLLHFHHQPGLGSAVGALVIGRSPDSWYKTVLVDRGRRNGVHPGEAVLAPGGVAGRVLAAGTDDATVLLLSDPESAVGAVVGKDGAPGVLVGQGSGELRLTLFQRAARVHVGEEVTTSGLGGVYPRGLPLGRIEKVGAREFGLEEYALVEPAADLDHLRDVLILKAPT